MPVPAPAPGPAPAPVTEASAAELDARDPLACYRERFVIHGDPVAYLDGNSLGRLPKATVERLHDVVDREWGTGLIRSWDERWFDLPTEVGDRLGALVLGAAPGQVVVADSTTVNLYKVLHAAAGLRSPRDEIVIDEANFPTDRFVVEEVAATRRMTVRWLAPGPHGGVTGAELAAALGPRTAVVVLSHVDYRSGWLADLEGLTAMTHAAGAVICWDLCHSAGVVPMALDEAGVDFAVGCTYKYLNGGPGAPAYLYAPHRHQAHLSNPIPGWFGARDVFAMAERYQPAAGVRRMLSGTPAVLGVVAVDEGVKLVGEAGLERIRDKSVLLTEMATAFVDAHLAPRGAVMVSPRDSARRGSHLVVRHPEARAISRRLTAQGVIPDLRHPDLIRLGLSPLTTSYRELWTALEVIRHTVAQIELD